MNRLAVLLAILAVVAIVVPADAQTDGYTKANARVNVRKNSGADVGKRRRLNLIEGSNVTLTVTDDSGNEEVDVTIAAAGGASGDNITVLAGAATDANFGTLPAAPANALNVVWQIDTAAAPDNVSAHVPYASGVLDVSGGNLTIANGGVTLARQADVATARIMGRVTAGSGVQEALTGTQATTLLDVFTSGLQGVVPASGGGTTNFLRADGTFAAPPGGGGGISYAEASAAYLAGF